MEAGIILLPVIFFGLVVAAIGAAFFNAIDKKAQEIYMEERYKIFKELEEREKEFTIRMTKQENALKFAIEAQDKIFNEKYEGFPWAKSFYENFVSGVLNAQEEFLRYKDRPALHAADIIKNAKERLKAKESEILFLRSIIDDYEDKFPWLKETRFKKKDELGYIESNEKKAKDMLISLNKQKNDLKEQESLLTKRLEEEKERQDKILEEKTRDMLASLNQQKNGLIKQKELQDKIFEEKTIGFPWAAEYYKNFLLKINEEYEYFLAFKNTPAPKSAKIVSEHSRKAAEATRKMLIYQAQLAYYESLFPWLTDFKEAPDEVVKLAGNTSNADQNNDPAKRFLSSGEWESLSKTEKFQKSLERYWKRHKSKWEIGRDFERFIGYEYEMDGYDVTYFGVIKGFEDMGRDLIAKKRGKTTIIQCKYWAKDKVIHEKHIFQLFGTCITYSIDAKKKNKQGLLLDDAPVVDGVFITSCTLSETARKVADILKIKYIENKKMTEWPSIKCNIGKDGEKIYHLPFDQQYDKIKISKRHNEFYATTIEEAETAGFRRAFRWHGSA